jgi:hypothetical protein
MPPMDGQFHNELSLIKNNKGEGIGVAVSGPVTWEGATSAKIYATVSQDNVTVGGVTEVTSADLVWAFTAIVDGNDLLGEGSGATGRAIAVVRTAEGATKYVSWSSPPDPPGGLTLG